MLDRRVKVAGTLVGLVVVAPFLVLVWQSTRDLNPFEARDSFVGARNFAQVLSDSEFRDSLTVTATYSLSSALLSALVGLAAAWACYSSGLSARVMTLLVAPFFVAPIVSAIIFAFVLDGQLGLAPKLLDALGAEDPMNIVGHPTRSFWALVAIDVWQWFGVVALLSYALMRRVPRSLLDLVATNGGGRWPLLREVWWPALSRPLIAIVLFRFFWCAGDAERIDALTAGGGPHGANRVLSIWLERTYFRYADYGYAAAASVLVYVVCLLAIRAFTLLTENRSRVL